jgi:hypothetical protein
MSLKIFFISSMYTGALESFYEKHNNIKHLSYNEHYELLLEKTTEFVGSYIRGFKKLGFDAKCIIANDDILQAKWQKEYGHISDHSMGLIYQQVNSFKPEILWVDNLNYVDRSWLNVVRSNITSVRLIVGYHCSPYGSKILETLKAIDFIITCTPGLKSELENNGLRSYCVYHGFDDHLISGLTDNSNLPKNDFVFSGSLIPGGKFHDERIKLIEALLKENIDIALYVNLDKQLRIKAKQSIYLVYCLLRKLSLEKVADKISIFDHGKNRIDNYSDALLKSCHPPFYGIDMYKLFSRSEIVLNMHIGVAGNYAGNMRLFEVTGVGSCLLTDNKKNIGDLFDKDNEVVVYDNPEDCIRKVKWLLENTADRKRIAQNGQNKTLKYHTVANRCNEISEILIKEIKK